MFRKIARTAIIPVAALLLGGAAYGIGAKVTHQTTQAHAAACSPSGSCFATMISTTAVYGSESFAAPQSSRAAGAPVIVECQAQGPTVYGTYGADGWWDVLASGQWVPDAYVFTGSNGQAAKGCG